MGRRAPKVVTSYFSAQNWREKGEKLRKMKAPEKIDAEVLNGSEREPVKTRKNLGKGKKVSLRGISEDV